LEDGKQISFTDDITFDNNLMEINAKQNVDDGYSRDITVMCSTDDFLTQTESEVITV